MLTTWSVGWYADHVTHLTHDGPRRDQADIHQLHSVVAGACHAHPHSVHLKALSTGVVLGDIPGDITLVSDTIVCINTYL